MLRQGTAKLTILVEGNGMGHPEDAQAGVGSRLVRLLVEQPAEA
jgi:two-component sensor histidine kinase